MTGMAKERPATSSDNFEEPAELPFRSVTSDREHVRSALQNCLLQKQAGSNFRIHLINTLSKYAMSEKVSARDASHGVLAPHRGRRGKDGCAPVLLWHNKK